MKRCPRCNRPESEVKFYGEFCENCARRDVADKVKNKVEIMLCKKCGKIRVSGEFVDFSEESLEDAINRQIKTNRFKLVEFNDKMAKGLIMERTRDGTIKSDFQVELAKKIVTCDACYKKSAGYYEAVFQLRGNLQKINTFIGRIERYFEKHGGFITRTEDTDNGIEVFVSSKSIASALISASRLKPVRSYTLSGVKNGKKVYRNTYTLRFGE